MSNWLLTGREYFFSELKEVPKVPKVAKLPESISFDTFDTNFVGSQKAIFIELYNSLVPLYDWNELDHQAWQADYEEDADTVIRCLMALKKSWDEGRYGAMIESDWPNP